MYAVFGLGNPDKEYDKTRHNIGFDVIDELASQMGVEVKTKRHKALCGIGNIGGEKVILVKPQTYMNLSGESVRAVMDFYKLDPENDIIVISDDINLATGRIRIRAQGSAGGHNGLKSINACLGTTNYARLRFGIGNEFKKGVIEAKDVGSLTQSLTMLTWYPEKYKGKLVKKNTISLRLKTDGYYCDECMMVYAAFEEK